MRNNFLAVFVVVLLGWSTVFAAPAKKADPAKKANPVAGAAVKKVPPAPVQTSTVTLSGPIQIVSGPEPKAFQALEQRVGRIENRLGNLERGQKETNLKLDRLLGKVDQILAPEVAKNQALDAEKKLAKKEGYIRHTCQDGREYCFWRPTPGDKPQVYDWSMETWCMIQTFDNGDWYMLRGNCYRHLLPAAETKAVMVKIEWLK